MRVVFPRRISVLRRTAGKATVSSARPTGYVTPPRHPNACDSDFRGIERELHHPAAGLRNLRDPVFNFGRRKGKKKPFTRNVLEKIVRPCDDTKIYSRADDDDDVNMRPNRSSATTQHFSTVGALHVQVAILHSTRFTFSAR